MYKKCFLLANTQIFEKINQMDLGSVIIDNKYNKKRSGVGKKLEEEFGIFDIGNIEKEPFDYYVYVKVVMAFAQFFDDNFNNYNIEIDSNVKLIITNGGYINVLLYTLLTLHLNDNKLYEEIYNWINRIITYFDQNYEIIVVHEVLSAYSRQKEIYELLEFLSSKGFLISYFDNKEKLFRSLSIWTSDKNNLIKLIEKITQYV